MKIRPLVLRNRDDNWTERFEAFRTDHISLSGHRGDILTKASPMEGPQTAQAPASGPVYFQNYQAGDIWLNEFHYDNTGTDAGEFVEVAGLAGTNLAGWRIVLYTGSNGTFYDDDTLSGALTDQGNGFGTFALTYPANGIQNGSTGITTEPDGIALIRPNGTVAAFISYEGAFAATNGPASGLTSTNVGVGIGEPGTAAGTSIGLIGSGNDAGDFTWALITDDTPGAVNVGQTFVSGGGGETQTVVFSTTSVTLAEGNSGTTAFTFTVARSGGTTGQLNFSGNFSIGSTNNADYVGGTAPIGFSGLILAGQLTGTVTINVQGDFTIEGNEQFGLVLNSVSNTDGSVTAQLGANVNAAGNITNDDAPGTISVGDVSLAEGDAGTTAGTFTLTRTGGATGTVSVDYLITLPGGVGGADGSDVSGPLSGTVTFLEGETSATIPFTVNGDLTNEPNETFTVTLSNEQGGAAIGDGIGIATITNDDAPPTISIGDASLVEGNNGVTYLVFTVSLSKPSVDPVTVDFSTAGGSATDGNDYLGLSGQLSFAPGDTSETISIPLIGDTVPENNETLTVTLSSPTGGTIADGSATGTITNDDGPQYYSLAGGSFSQDWTNIGQIIANDNWGGVPYIIGYLGDIDAGSSTNVDARTLTGPATGAIDVIANLANTTSNSGGVGEFHLTNPVVGLQGSGTADAPSLVLYMDASGRSNVRLQANLRDIDSTVVASVEDNAAQQINVQYRTSPGGPWINVPGAYFADVTATGATMVTALDVTLPPGADNAATLEIRIMTTNAAGNDEWVGIDDIIVSSQTSGPVLSIANTAVVEGDAGPTLITFTVTRAGSSSGAVTADYAVTFGSGPYDAESEDFTALSPLAGQVSFADGQTTATITLSVDGDVGPEVDENFTVQLSNATGGTIADGAATGTIVNDDGPPPLVTINDVSVVEGNSGSVNLVFTVTRTGGTGAFNVDFFTTDITAASLPIGPGQDYVTTSGTVNFLAGEMSRTISVPVLGDTDSELAETFQVTLTNATNFAVITDSVGIGTIASDDPIFIHDIQGTSYFSPILAAEGINSFNVASVGTVIVRAVVTAVDNDGVRQGFYLQEELGDWDANSFTSEGIFVFTGASVSGVSVGDIVTVTAHVMEYQGFATNMPVTTLTNPGSIVVNSSGNPLPALTLGAMPTAIMTGVQPDYTDFSDGVGDSFDASLYALSYWETVEGMLVTLPDVVVADGFFNTSGGQPIFQAYSQSLTDADQINSRGGLTIAGDPPIGDPDTPETVDDTTNGGRALTDGDINPDIIEIDFSGFAVDAPAGLGATLSMGDELGDITGIIEFDFTDRKLFVTDYDPDSFVDHTTTQDVTVFGDDSRSLTVATFNVENLDPGDALSKFQGLAAAIANNLNAPDIICIEEMQDNNGAAAGDGIDDDPITPGMQDTTGADASQSWQMLVDALNAATGKNYQWVDQEPNGSEGGEPGGNIRVGFIYDTDRVQLGDLDANATLAERRQYTDRIGDAARDANDLIAFDDSMLGSEIQTGDWAGTRRSLLGEFNFHGNTVYLTANHWPAKTQSDDFWEFVQNPAAGEPTNAGWTQRNNVAQDVYSMLDLIGQADPGVGLVAGGDFNDFYFYRPLTTMTGHTMADGTARVGGTRLENLTLTLPEAERYTYNFDGRSQAIDHIIVNGLLGDVATYDVVHLNTGFNSSVDTLSDHDPGVATFDYRNFSEVLNGTASADMIDGFGGDDTLRGGSGNDVLYGGPGVDILDGGADDDVMIVDTDDSVIEAVGGGNDLVAALSNYLLAAGAEVETLSTTNSGGNAAIALTGNAFGQLIIGNAGNNFLYGAGGADILDGRAGDDMMIVDGDDVVIEAVGGGNDRVMATSSYLLSAGAEVETLSTNNDGSNLAIALTGNELGQTIIGNAGNNFLYGAGGADTLDGGAGNDVIIVDGDDIVIEAVGGGNDRVMATSSYLLSAGAEVETLSTNNDGSNLAIALTGNEFGQLIIGNAGNNFLYGAGGADTLNGGAGNDVMIVDTDDVVIEAVGGGNDLVMAQTSFALNAGAEVETLSTNNPGGNAAINLTGNAFGQTIIGNAGANVLDGKGGNDSLVGLGGADTFAFTTALGAGNVDIVVGFELGADKIALDDAIFTAIGGLGALNADAFVTGSAAADASDRIIYNSLTGQLFYDADGTGAGAAVQFAQMNPGVSLSASDFQVI